MQMGYRIAVIGATGNVGHETLQLLAERDFPVDHIHAVASDRSAGIKISFGEEETLSVVSLNHFDFQEIDLAFFCTSGKISREYVPRALAAGCKIVDKSSEFRLHADVALVVPEVNFESLSQSKKGLVANPNCVTIPLALALKPLHDMAGVKRVVIATYQSVSGAGKEAMDELYQQTRATYVNQTIEPHYLPRPIAFNVIPHIDAFGPDGYTGEEAKIAAEIKKIVASSIKVAATCVRVPVYIGHSMAVSVELEKPITVKEARELFTRSEGLMVVDRPTEDIYVTPMDVVGEDVAVVSRIRQDLSVPSGLLFWISCDNLRKGAALNGVQIAEKWLNINK
jgi:aspartate-semialdehyde dehydrogenase